MVILGSECSECGKRIVPPRALCPYCRSDKSETIELSEEGVILSYTILQMPPEGFEPPVILGLVELDRAVILCLSEQEKTDDLEIGSKVLVHMDSDERFIFTLK
ncbi:MAG: Zn-ribbon domain-containing OB-fold protein [Candidatus Thorarchaeota archaeon]